MALLPVKHLLTTCLPTDSENRPAGDFSLPAGQFYVIQLAFRLHRFLAWKVVMVRSFGFSSCGLTSTLAMPWSIFHRCPLPHLVGDMGVGVQRGRALDTWPRMVDRVLMSIP